MKEFTYLGVLFMSEDKMEIELDRRISAASVIMWVLYRTVGVKKELNQKAKLGLHPNTHLWSQALGND